MSADRGKRHPCVRCEGWLVTLPASYCAKCVDEIQSDWTRDILSCDPPIVKRNEKGEIVR